jgi:ABC-type amino acid transport substrate-binding protein
MSTPIAIAIAIFALFAAPNNALSTDEKSDLNAAVSAAISTMSADGFLDATYVRFFGPPSRSVKACGVSAFFPESLVEFDSDLARVLRAGVVRVAFSTVGLSNPILFKNNDGTLNGYEAVTANEAFRRIGVHYGRRITVQFVEIAGPAFFGPLATALARRRVDIAWTRIAALDSRAVDVDFTCSSFSSTNALVSTDGAVTTFAAFTALGLSVGAGTKIKVACVTSSNFCLVPLPAGFEFDDSFANTGAVQAALAGGSIKFAVINGEQIAFDIRTGIYTGVNINTFADISLAPATRRLERPIVASNIVAVASAHAADVRAEISASSLAVKTAEAIAAHVTAAESRYKQLCAQTTRHATCADAVDDAFDKIHDAFSDKSVSDAQSDISDGDDDDDDN